MSRAPMTATLTWQDELRFDAASGDARTVLDSKGQAGPSPMQSLAFALAGCMAIDVVDIVRKGRHLLTGLTATLSARRAEEPPRRFEQITLHYVVTGDVPAQAVERAIQLSRDKYCSVWHSMRQDIEFVTTFEVHP
ncbi:MAG: OsmC family protein [Acidobacteriota bacterium]